MAHPCPLSDVGGVAGENDACCDHDHPVHTGHTSQPSGASACASPADENPAHAHTEHWSERVAGVDDDSGSPVLADLGWPHRSSEGWPRGGPTTVGWGRSRAHDCHRRPFAAAVAPCAVEGWPAPAGMPGLPAENGLGGGVGLGDRTEADRTRTFHIHRSR